MPQPSPALAAAPELGDMADGLLRPRAVEGQAAPRGFPARESSRQPAGLAAPPGHTPLQRPAPAGQLGSFP